MKRDEKNNKYKIINYTWVIWSLLTWALESRGDEANKLEPLAATIAAGADTCAWWCTLAAEGCWCLPPLPPAAEVLGLDLSLYLTSITFLFSWWGLHIWILGEGIEHDIVITSSSWITPTPARLRGPSSLLPAVLLLTVSHKLLCGLSVLGVPATGVGWSREHSSSSSWAIKYIF